MHRCRGTTESVYFLRNIEPSMGLSRFAWQRGPSASIVMNENRRQLVNPAREFRGMPFMDMPRGEDSYSVGHETASSASKPAVLAPYEA